MSKRYGTVDLEVKLVIGIASLEFELWFHNNKIATAMSDSFQVDLVRSMADQEEWAGFDRSSSRTVTMSSYATTGGGRAR